MGIKGTRYTGLKGYYGLYFRCTPASATSYSTMGAVYRVAGLLPATGKSLMPDTMYRLPGEFLEFVFEGNVHGQCKKCNNLTWTPDASIPFAYELDRRCGKGTTKMIYKKSQGIPAVTRS